MAVMHHMRRLFQKRKRWTYAQTVPLRQLAVLLGAVFLLFSVIGFYTDLRYGGLLPFLDVLIICFISGVNAALWVIAVTRLPVIGMIVLAICQLFVGAVNGLLIDWADALFHPAIPTSKAGLDFSSTSILICVIASYILFTRYMGITGRETFRISNELELAHGIQKTLVPPISITAAHFEIYGISDPSEKVGGDLVDVVQLPNGDCIAYLADIAGHGLQAGILMGMLKTAARTALTDTSSTSNEATLASLMERLNTVLPQVKEAHMYATFTALRLNTDSRSFYGMAASPPLLHWRASEQRIDRIEEQQFPLGLLPVSGFPAHTLPMTAGDIIVIATDGILEVNPSSSQRRPAHDSPEFGIEALEALVSRHAHLPLHELAQQILIAVRRYGKQLDDQTLLIVRRLP